MVDYQPRHASQNIHCTTSKSHHMRRADTVSISDALSFTRHTLADARERLKEAGVDQGILDSSFGPVLASLAESPGRAAPFLREAGKDRREHDAACREACEGPDGHADPAVQPPIPDLPGASLRPDPGVADTIAEFLTCLRNYRLWAGNPSFRVMSKNCERRYAPSTLCTALGGDSLPTLEMVVAIVAACGGPQQHQREFATAWRRLVIPRQQSCGRVAG